MTIATDAAAATQSVTTVLGVASVLSKLTPHEISLLQAAITERTVVDQRAFAQLAWDEAIAAAAVAAGAEASAAEAVTAIELLDGAYPESW